MSFSVLQQLCGFVETLKIMGDLRAPCFTFLISRFSSRFLSAPKLSWDPGRSQVPF